MRSNLFAAAVALTCFLLCAQGAPAAEYYYDARTGNVDHWMVGAGYDWQKKAFHQVRLDYASGVPAMDWTFRLKTLEGGNDCELLYNRAGLKAADEYVLTVRNLGTDSVKLGIGMTTFVSIKSGPLQWYAWDNSRISEVPADGAWHELVFSWEDFSPVSPDTADKPLFPSQLLRVFTSKAPADRPLHLQLKSVEFRTRTERRAAVKLAGDGPFFPSQLTAGQKFTLPEMTVAFDGGRLPLDNRLFVEIKDWFNIPVNYTVVEGAYHLPEQELTLPLYLPSDTIDFCLNAGEVTVAAAKVAVQGRQADLPQAEVKRHNGIPTIFVDGEPEDGMMRATFSPGKGVWQPFIDAGVELFSLGITPTDQPYGYLERQSWHNDGSYDFSQLNEFMQDLLILKPDARVLVRLSITAPQWWLHEHPEAMVLVEREDGMTVPFENGYGRQVPSWANPVWREAACDSLRALVAYIRQMPWADRIIGFNLASGTTQEWINWNISNDVWEDYSPVNTAAFRQWLEKRYTTDAALQESWGDSSVTLKTARIPGRQQRSAVLPSDLFELPRDQRVVDYDWFNSDNNVDAICTLARAVKEASDGRLLAGAFYGYCIELSNGHAKRLNRSSHLATDRMLANPDIDFFCSPAGYGFRYIGGRGTSYYMVLLNSIQAHDKFYYLEDDLRTYLLDGAANRQMGAGDSPADDVLQVDKEAVHAFCAGVFIWWFDVGYIPFDIPEMMARIKEWTRVSKELLPRDRTPNAEIAFVVDERSANYFRFDNHVESRSMIWQLVELKHVGAPVEVWSAGDLAKLPERIRMVILATSVAPSPEQIRALKKLQREGRVVLFSYAAGAIKDGRISAETMSEFTGIKAKFSTQPADETPQLTVKTASSWMPGLKAGDKAGAAHRLSRATTTTLPVVVDEDAIVLAARPNGEASIAVKSLDGWKSVVAADGWMPLELLIGAAQNAGVHRYITTPDQVWSNNSMLGICVKDAGVRTITLPKPATVRRALDGAVVSAEPVTAFEWDFAAASTELFLLD